MRKPFARLTLVLCLFYAQRSFSQPICGFDALHGKSIKTDSAYRNIIQQNEARLQTIIQEQAARRALAPNARMNATNAPLYIIPVVVHVVHTGGAVGSLYNPSDAAITGAINYLNQIYAGTYAGTEGVGDIQIQFALATRDANCNASNGIDRLDGSSIPNYLANGVNAAASGGATELAVKNSSRWDPYSYYNIWVVHKIDGKDGTSGQFIAGFARLAGGSPAYDGTIMLATQMGAGFKTLPHEIGHALNLYHPFEGSPDAVTCPANSNCNNEGDYVCDTDPISYNQTGGVVNFSCRTGANPCASPNTYSINTEHNFMNYTSCFTLFTAGQKNRMLAAMSLPGRREYATGWALSGTYPVSFATPALNCTPATDPAGLAATKAGIYDVSVGNRIFSSSVPAVDNGFLNRAGSCLNLIQLQENGTYSFSSTLLCINYEQIAAWIDYNNNGTFETGERLLQGDFIPNGGPRTVTTSFTVPASAVKGSVLRMRVMDELSTGYDPAYQITGPCYNPIYGQAEDYPVLISASSLPLTMDYFKGFKQGITNHLVWKTVAEYNTDSFHIERSYNGSDYTRIGSVEASGIASGSTYSYDDNSFTGAIVYYRLKQVDLNGSYTYTNIVILRSAAVNEAEVTVLNNPFHRQFDISFNTPAPAKAVINLLDATGKLVYRRTAEVSGSTILTVIPRVSNLATGLYIVQVQLNGKTFTMKVVKD